VKILLLKSLLCITCFCLFFGNGTSAQNMINGKEVDTSFNTAMNHIFNNLDKTKIPFGLLRDYAMEFTNLENYNGTALADSNYIDKGILWQIYTTLTTARITAGTYTTLPDPGVIDSLFYKARKAGQVTLCGLFYQYAFLASNADSTGKITVTNGQLSDKYVNGVWQNPYLQANVVGFSPSTNTYQGLGFNIKLPSNLWLTNSSTIVSSIQVDAADGLGYRKIGIGVNLPVTYADTGMKTLNFKLYLTNGAVLQSHARLHIIPDPLVTYGGGPNEGAPVTSNGLTTTTVLNVYNVTSTTKYQNKAGQGIVTVVYAQNHASLVNPLIVVEGFDPGIYFHPELPTGEYSIADFITSVKAAPNLYNLLVSKYDIVFVDFRDGTDDIHRNALIVEDVVRWVNAHKTGNNKNVVLGLSMGGLCARYALKKMENGGETHQVGLFISHGTPQQGAVLPLGIQYLDNHADDLYARAGFGATLYSAVRLFAPSLPNIGGITSLTDVPAAKQMLIERVSNFQINNSVHIAWQTELTALGYPSQGGIRNIAISNGSQCGQPQTLGQGGQILYIDGKLSTKIVGDLIGAFLSPLFSFTVGQPSFLLGLVPGRNDVFVHFEADAAVDGGGNLAYTGKITYRKTILWLIPVDVTITNRSYTSPAGIYPYETLAGDFYNLSNLIKSFTLQASIDYLAKFNITFNAAPTFGFVPTASALDIGKGSVTLSESDYSIPYTEASPPSAPKNTPFANFITAYSQPAIGNSNNNNEEHISYETRNGNWLANELNNTPTIADCTALCQINSISGDDFNCNNLKIYSVPSFSNVTYHWSASPNLQIIGRQDMPTFQIQPLSGTNGQHSSITVTLTCGDCGQFTLTKAVTIGIEPLVVNSTVDRTVQSSHYQYLTATATQLGNTVPSNYNWYLVVNNQPTTLIGNGLVLNRYPIAPCSTIYYQCVATTLCGPSVYNGYAYNTYCSGAGAMTGQSIVVYPNPADNTMTVTNNNIPAATDATGNTTGIVPQAYRVVVLNSTGNVLKSAQNANGDSSVTFTTADLPNGNYFLHVIQGTNVIEKQIIIQH